MIPSSAAARACFLSLATIAAATCAQEPEARPLEGRWIAEASLPGEAMALRRALTSSGGALVARLTVPAERVLGLRLAGFGLADGDVSFRIPHPDHPMDFAGRVAGETIDGALSMGGRELPLVFTRA